MGVVSGTILTNGTWRVRCCRHEWKRGNDWFGALLKSGPSCWDTSTVLHGYYFDLAKKQKVCWGVNPVFSRHLVTFYSHLVRTWPTAVDQATLVHWGRWALLVVQCALQSAVLKIGVGQCRIIKPLSRSLLALFLLFSHCCFQFQFTHKRFLCWSCKFDWLD